MRALAPAFRTRAPRAPSPRRRLPYPTPIRLPLTSRARSRAAALFHPLPFRSAPNPAAALRLPDRLTALTRQSRQQVTP